MTLEVPRAAGALTPPRSVTAARTRLMLEGPVVSTLLRLAAPNLVVNVVLIAVTASVDAHFVGQLGAEALAGLALVFPLVMLMQQMANMAIGGAIAAAVARAIGGGRQQEASALIIHGLVIGVGMAALFSLGFLLGGPHLYALMEGDGAVRAAALDYSNAIFAGALAYWLQSTFTSAIRGTGQVGVLAVVYILVEVVHILLVPVLVFGAGPIPALGISGAGIATVSTTALSALVLGCYLASRGAPAPLSLGGIRFEWRLFRDILRVGAPTCLQPILNNVALATLTAYAGTFGVLALAGFGAAVRLEYLQYPLVFGLGAAVLAMVGTNIGAGRVARATRITWVATALAAAATGCVGLLAFIWPELWIGFFSAKPDAQAAAASYLAIVALSYPLIGLNTLASAYQAMGQTFWPLMAVGIRTLVAVGGGWFVVHATDSGLIGLAVVTVVGLVLGGAAVALAFRRTIAVKA